MEKINIAELLKDCPRGMELYSPLCGTCVFDRLNMGTIICKKQNTQEITFTSEGYYMLPVFDNCECMIFPSKDQRDWSKFQRPFKAGDVLCLDCANEESDGDLYKYIFILKEIDSFDNYFSYCHLSIDGFFSCSFYLVKNRYTPRLATEEEKEKLFQAIKANGYRWNTETKTLEKLAKPTFKVGNKIRSKLNQSEYIIIDIREDVYIIKSSDKFGHHIPFANEINYELVPNKFDIKTLVPFESRVLVRDDESQFWRTSLWGCFIKTGFMYDTVRGIYKQCIPYEGNEHLLGETADCEEYYKTWE